MDNNLDGFMPNVMTLDTKKRFMGYTQLLSFLRDPRSSLECEDMDGFINGLVGWISGSNFKISVNGLEILCLMVDRMGENFKPHVTSVLPAVIDRLGDSKDQVREQAQTLLLKLMLPGSTPQYVFDRLTPAFSHKLWHVREGILLCLQSTINRYGARSLSLSKLTPSICKMLDDSTPQVREAAVNTLTEMYRHVGERLRQDLIKKNISQTRLNSIFAKFEEQKLAGNMLPTADAPVRSESKSSQEEEFVFAKPAPLQTKRSTAPKPAKYTSSRSDSRCRDSTTSGTDDEAQFDKPTPKVSQTKRSTSRSSKSPAVSSSGAVDEEFFIKSFEDVPKMQIFSARDVQDNLKKIEAVLSNPSNDWEKRNDAMINLRALIVNGAAEYEEFYLSLRMLENCFTLAVKDLRSQVVREACITIAYLAKQLTNRVEHLAEMLLQPLINLIPNSAKIMSTSGIVCTRFIIQFLHSNRLIPIITNNTAAKSGIIRRYGFEYLNQVLNTWPKHCLEKHIATIQDCIKRGMSDADPDARVFSRKAFWGFSHHFKDQADSLLNNLDSSKQKMLQGEISTSSSNNSLNSEQGLRMPKPRVRSHSQDRTDTGAGAFVRNSATRSSTTGRISSSRSEANSWGEMDVEDQNTFGAKVPAKNYVSPYGQTYLLRSSSDLNLANGSKSSKSRSAALLTAARLEKGSYSSLPRQKSSSISSKTVTNLVTPERSRTRSRIGVSQSQPSSRSGSPSSRLTYITNQSGRVDPMIPGRTRRTGIPRSQGASREGSREGSREASPIRTGTYGRVRRLSGSKISGRTGKGTILAQKVLQPGSDVEDALSDALARGPSRKRYDYDSDDAASETSSVCSFSSYSGRTSEDMQQIISQMNSGFPTERKEALISLQQQLRRHRMLSRMELKKITENFTRKFYEPQQKIFSVFLDVLVDLIVAHSPDLSDWLYVLLTRLINKFATDLLGSIQTKLQRALDTVRDNFSKDLQFTTIAKFIIDHSQSPTFKVKVCMLTYLHNLILTMDPSDFVSSIDPRLAVSRIITWTTEPKSVEVRKQAQLVLMALFNLNPPEFSLMLSAMPRTFQDGATKILHCHIGMGSSSGPHDVLSPRNATSPPGQNRHRPSRSSLSYPDDSETENFNPEEIYNSMKKVSEDIQNLSLKSKLDHYGDIEKKRDFTSQDSGIQDLRNDSPDGTDGRKRILPSGLSGGMLDNPTHSEESTLKKLNNSIKLEVVDVILDGNEETQDKCIGDILTELSNHNERNKERCENLEKLHQLTHAPWFTHWDEHFKSILFVLLETLNDNDSKIRLWAIITLEEVIKTHPDLFKEYAELTILRILEVNRDCIIEARWSAEGCGRAIAKAVASEQTMLLLNPIGQTAPYPINMAAIKMQIIVAQNLDKEQMMNILSEVLPALLKNIDYDHIRVRKAVVYCIVTIYMIVGEAMQPYLDSLPVTKTKLIDVYIKKAKAGEPF